MRFPRRSGILLHPTSLPGPYGIGDLGPAAYRFVDWLHVAGQRLWQVLPLGPTGYGDSPYQTLSAFAGNPLLISPERLAEQGLLTEDELAPTGLPDRRVDYGAVQHHREGLLRAAFARFAPDGSYDRWLEANADWLEEYVLFVALKEHFGGGAWVGWPDALKRRDPDALAAYREELADELEFHRFLQFQFYQQWITLRAYARTRDVALVGDIPIFIAHDSADAWANQEDFTIRADGTLELQAGVPPDYFSETGQLWGNPLYRWERMAAKGYDWWIGRMRATFNLVDLVRLDHFRGFEAYWAIPGDAETAIHGEWRPGPGAELFATLREALGELPIIAEDLGVITPEVVALRDRFDYPGMRIFQFAFTADTTSEFLPHNYARNTVAYTGTHDNETTRGWFENLDPATRERVLAYVHSEPLYLVHDMIRMLCASVADSVVFPMQDVLDLGNEARMNLPGRPGGNWQWRALASDFSPDAAAWLARLTELYGRR